jgi:hypothetical protein
LNDWLRDGVVGNEREQRDEDGRRFGESGSNNEPKSKGKGFHNLQMGFIHHFLARDW